MVYFLGVDAGKAGGFVVIDEDSNIIEKHVVPVRKKCLDILELCSIITILQAKYKPITALEETHSIYMASKGTMFTMGRVLGTIEAALACSGVNYKLVAPKAWQKVIWKDTDIVWKEGKKKSKDTKKTSLSAAKRIFGDIELYYGDNETNIGRRTKQHDGLVDALLIAKYEQLQWRT